MGKPAKLTPEQEFEVYKRAKEGETYEEIAASYGIHKSTITRVVQRVEERAVAAETQAPAQDPKTGMQVELSDELLLGQVIRDLTSVYQRSVGDTETKVAIAHVLPKLATARHRIRQPPPGPRPTNPQPPNQPPEPPKDDELVRFSN